MDEQALREACEKWVSENNPREFDFEAFITFAKAQRAAGVREGRDHLSLLIEVENGSTDDDVYTHLKWCEARARELEGMK